jgi:prevent-host-death family protein
MAPKSYSIADARKNLSRLVDDAMAGKTIHIHRRGSLVAVLVSPEQLDAHSNEAQTVADAYRAWRMKFGVDKHDLDPDEVFRDVRDRGPGRYVP